MKENNLIDVTEQFEKTAADLTESVIAQRGALDRILWLKDLLLKQFEEIREAADMLDVYTEDEAAKLLKLEAKHLATLRREKDLPCCIFGNKIRYTRAQILEIAQIFEVNSRNRNKNKK